MKIKPTRLFLNCKNRSVVYGKLQRRRCMKYVHPVFAVLLVEKTMNMKKLLFYLLIIVGSVSANSCKTFYTYYLGIRNPKIETIESICNFYKNNEKKVIPYLCIVKDSIHYLELRSKVRSIPRIQLFNRNGERIESQDSGYCVLKAIDFVQKLSLNYDFRIDPQNDFSEIRECLLPLGSKVNFDPKQSDITLVLFCAKFLGKGNNSNYKVLEAANRNQGIRFNFIVIDMDLMDIWWLPQKKG